MTTVEVPVHLLESEEHWLAVPDWPDYEVSDHGRVRFLPVYRNAGRAGMRWTSGKLLKPSLSAGMVTVSLHRANSKKLTIGIARLVLSTFVRPPLEGEVARHYHDPDPLNCYLWNLRWGTETENLEDQLRHYGKYPHEGRTHSDEAKAKIGAAHKGRKHTEEAKANMRESAKQRPPVSNETKAKMTESHLKRWAEKRGCD